MRMVFTVMILALPVITGGAVDTPVPTAAVSAAAIDHLQPESEWLRPFLAEAAATERTAPVAISTDAPTPPAAVEDGVAWWLIALIIAVPALALLGARRRPASDASATGRLASSDPQSGAFALHRAEPGTGSRARHAVGAGSGSRAAAPGVGSGSRAAIPGMGSGSRSGAGEGSGSRGTITAAHRRRPDGFSLLEVMIAVAIMSGCLAIMVGQVYTLDKAQQATRQMARVQEVAQVMAERVLGAPWTELGTTTQRWSWHRRDDAAALNPPLNENDLETLGLLQGRSGLANLRVYVEYFSGTVLLNVDNNRTWATNRGIAANRLPEDPALFNLRNQLNDIVIRIIIRWEASPGSDQRHELMLSRRQ